MTRIALIKNGVILSDSAIRPDLDKMVVLRARRFELFNDF